MTCEEAKTIVDSWLQFGTAGPSEYESLVEHTDGCRSCRGRYTTILPFIARDMGFRDAVPNERVEPTTDFSRRIMERIGSGTIAFRSRETRARQRVVRWVGAAAIASLLLVAVGIGFRSYYARFDERTVVVHFVLDAPGARQVALVGSFVDWNPDKLLLRREGSSSRWEISIPLKRGETYLYNFVIDGKTWIPDPATDVKVSDGFGGQSSLMQL